MGRNKWVQSTSEEPGATGFISIFTCKDNHHFMDISAGKISLEWQIEYFGYDRNITESIWKSNGSV